MWTALFILFFLIVGLGVVFAAMRSGSKGPVLDSRKRGARRAVAWITGVAVAVFLVAVPVTVAIDNSDAEGEVAGLTLTKQEEEGRKVFNDACVQCHTLGASNAVQLVGPDLDAMRPPKELVIDAVEKGRARGQGQMPANLVSGPELEALAAYVAKVAGRADAPGR